MKKCFLQSLFILYLLFISGCREDIIDPGNVAGNINEPIQENKLNYYSVTINSRDLTTKFSTKTYFNYSTNKALLSISDISKGTVTIIIKDKAGSAFYLSTVQTDVLNDFKKLSGAIPELIEISFNNFTGKLRFSLSYTSD